jgi:UDP-GlcNAc:undecaprenyl-phosphate/decaprenyl-phosphate GlcNAc-1-phosphate transferase
MTFSLAAGPALPIIAVAFAVAAVVALLATPWITRLLVNREILDHPGERRVHASPVPRGGGVAVVIAFVLVGGSLAAFGGNLSGVPDLRFTEPDSLAALFGGGILAAVFGAADDRYNLRARWQFLGQLILAAVAVAGGIVIERFGNPIGPGVIHLDTLVAIGFTVLWIVGMINSLNFIDGLDGLSSGIGLIAAVTLGVLSLTVQVDEQFVSVLCFALAGGLLGFLRWNFHPARIFQGTAGVMFLGYTIGVLSILGEAKVAVAMLVLAVPIIDSFWVIVRRVSSGHSPFSPDRGHIHHRLLDLGLSHRATVLVIYAVCLALGLLSLFVSTAIAAVAFVVALIVFGLVAYALPRRVQEAA